MLKMIEPIIKEDVQLDNVVEVLRYFVDVLEIELEDSSFAFICDEQIFTNSKEVRSKLENNTILTSGNQTDVDYTVYGIDNSEVLFVINSTLLNGNERTIRLYLNIIKLLKENILSRRQNKESKQLLSSKIEQLSQLYDLSKEFSGILELDYVSKLIIFSIVGQFLMSNFAILYINEDIEVLESRMDKEKVKRLVAELDYKNLDKAVFTNENYPGIFKAGFEVVLPMQIKSETKGLILLGEKKNKEPYTKHDIEYINSVGSLAIISIENAILFKEALEKKAIERDIETARIIQKNLLPHTIIQPDGYEIAAYSESAKQVGGDYFDLLSMSDKETIFAMGDVSGKGITASLLVANSQAYLKSISKQNLPLDESTNLLNDLVEESTVSGTYITFFWGKLNSKKELTYVNAGHNPPLLVRNGELMKLEKGGLILGMMKTMMPYESETIKLESGDFIVTFTDGVTEAMNSAEEEYSDESLENLCKGLKSESAEEAKELILADVKKFTSGFEQSDDLTLMVIKVK